MFEGFYLLVLLVELEFGFLSQRFVLVVGGGLEGGEFFLYEIDFDIFVLGGLLME